MTARHVIGDEFQHRGSLFRQPSGNRQQEIAPVADVSHKPEKLLQRDTLAAENVAMSRLSALHSKNKAGCDIAHVDEIDGEIEVQVKPPAKEMPDHRGRRGKA